MQFSIQCVPKNNITSSGKERERERGGPDDTAGCCVDDVFFIISIYLSVLYSLKVIVSRCKTDEPVCWYIEMDCVNKFSLIF